MEAVTQALLIGFIVSVPFILFALALNEWAIAVLGAESEVVRIGALYLLVILLSSPARHTVLIAARAIQGTGDTRSPMVIRSGANVINVLGTATLAFGFGPAPELGIIGIAVATAGANYLEALSFLWLITSSWSVHEYVRPTDPIIGKQLVLISLPRIAEGLTELVAEFPFNAILLVFGTEQCSVSHRPADVPADRCAAVAGVRHRDEYYLGQTLGKGEIAEAKCNGWTISALAMVTVGGLGVVLFFVAEWFVLLFTRDPATVAYAADFARAYALSTILIALYVVLAGALRGGSETRMPFFAKLSGTFIFLLGTIWVFGLYLKYGVMAAYAGIVADYTWRNVVLCAYYTWGGWLEQGADMMADRGSTDTQNGD